MCGLFGFIGDRNTRVSLKVLQRVALDTQTRGPHAFGFAWIDSRNRLKMFKSAGRISDHLALLNLASDAEVLIGHCRYATHGDPKNNVNNHPFACDGGWLVHNGVVHNHVDMMQDRDLQPISKCDTEALAL